MPEPQNKHVARDILNFLHFVASKSTFSYEFSLEPQNLLPRNRCFVRGFCQFSSHISNCNACHGICTLSQLCAALTTGLATNTQHDTSEVLRLPRKMTMEVSKVLRLPRKLQLIFWKRSKALKTIFDTWWNMLECHKEPCVPRETKLRNVWNLQKYPKMTTCAELAIGTAIATYLRTVADSYKRLQTVADGCGGRSGVKRTRLHPQTPKVNREPFATHSGKNYTMTLHVTLYRTTGTGMHPSIHLSIHLSFHPSIYLYAYLLSTTYITWHCNALHCFAYLCTTFHTDRQRERDRERERESTRERERVHTYLCLQWCFAYFNSHVGVPLRTQKSKKQVFIWWRYGGWHPGYHLTSAVSLVEHSGLWCWLHNKHPAESSWPVWSCLRIPCFLLSSVSLLW